MFGYVVADQGRLTPTQTARYRECYCGLCRAIQKQHGQMSRLSLTYDMTFLVLLLDSLYEPTISAGAARCVVHPVRKQLQRISKYTEYAADMNVALAYHNCLDDWNDDRNAVKFFYSKVLQSKYQKIAVRWPHQCKVMEETLHELSALELKRSPDLDRASRLFGQLMAALFAPEQDRWSEILAQIGDKLGQFIYVMDACLDQTADQSHHRYNPITEFQHCNGSFDAGMTLTMLIGDCSMAFEQLPLEQDLDLLRNILYSGVWSKWASTQKPESPPPGGKPQ